MKIWLKSPDPNNQCCDCSVLSGPCATCQSLCDPITGNSAVNLYPNSGSQFFDLVEKTICFPNGGSASVSSNGSLLTFSSQPPDNCQTVANNNTYQGISNSIGLFFSEFIIYSGETITLQQTVPPANISYVNARFQPISEGTSFGSGMIGSPTNPYNGEVLHNGDYYYINGYVRNAQSSATTALISDYSRATPLYITSTQLVSSGNIINNSYVSIQQGVDVNCNITEDSNRIVYPYQSKISLTQTSLDNNLSISCTTLIQQYIQNGAIFYSGACPHLAFPDFDYSLNPHDIGLTSSITTKITNIYKNLLDLNGVVTGVANVDHGCYSLQGLNLSSLQIFDTGNNPVQIISRMRKYVYPSLP